MTNPELDNLTQRAERTDLTADANDVEYERAQKALGLFARLIGRNAAKKDYELNDMER